MKYVPRYTYLFCYKLYIRHIITTSLNQNMYFTHLDLQIFLITVFSEFYLMFKNQPKCETYLSFILVICYNIETLYNVLLVISINTHYYFAIQKLYTSQNQFKHRCILSTFCVRCTVYKHYWHGDPHLEVSRKIHVQFLHYTLYFNSINCTE